MRFSYVEGPYTQYWGYTFANGLPTTVPDKATQERLLRDSRFRRIDDEEEKQETAEAEVLNSPDACPKCGRVIRQGKYMHVKYCQGVT